MGSSGTAVLSHTGQVLKREATTGHPALFPPAVVTVGPLTPQWSPEEGRDLGFRSGPPLPPWKQHPSLCGPLLSTFLVPAWGKKARGQDPG